MYHFCFAGDAGANGTGVCGPRRTLGILAEWLRRQTRNLVGSALVGSNPADVDQLFAPRRALFAPRRSVGSYVGMLGPQVLCVYSTRVVFNPSKVKIRVRVPMDAHLLLLFSNFLVAHRIKTRGRVKSHGSARVV